MTAYRTPARVTPDPSREAAKLRPLVYRPPVVVCLFCRRKSSIEHVGVCYKRPGPAEAERLARRHGWRP